MEYKIIKTGSKGNATIINNFILIDCGVSFNLLKDYYKNIKVVFITHSHSDHFYKPCVRALVERRPNLKFVVTNYLAEELIGCGANKSNIILIATEKWYNFKAFKCRLDEIPHDVPNVAIHLEINNERLIYATDTSSINHVKANNYEYYFIEGNYKEEELERRKQEKLLNGDFVIEDRIANSHLSYEKCIDYFMKMSKDNSILEIMHQHVFERKEKEQ